MVRLEIRMKMLLFKVGYVRGLIFTGSKDGSDWYHNSYSLEDFKVIRWAKSWLD